MKRKHTVTIELPQEFIRRCEYDGVKPEVVLRGWHCFGCNAGGTVIDWIMRSHKVSFRHACELLAKQHPALGTPVSDEVWRKKKLSQAKLRQTQSFSPDETARSPIDSRRRRSRPVRTCARRCSESASCATPVTSTSTARS